MELKELGNSGVMVPEIGIGVWRYSAAWNRYAGESNSERS
jgi:aryl-alcohol dehydrogenase-like predicted oxidoreductase